MFSKTNRSGSKSSKPVTTSKGSGPVGTPADKAATKDSKPAVAPAATVVVDAKPVAAVAVAPVAKTEAGRDRSAVIALVAKLRDPDADTARDAATTLGNLSVDAEAVTALAGVLHNHDGYYHSVVRAAAAEALGKLGDRRAIDALIEATRDNMAEASEQAIHALGLLGDARAIPALEAAVRNEHGFYLEHVRKTAADAIISITKATKAAKA
jgi:HEAT repeat protein